MKIEPILPMITLIMFFLQSNVPAQEPKFRPRLDRGLVQEDRITEASGMVASRKNPGILWVHNDSGDKNRIYAMDDKGQHIGQFEIKGAQAGDWEDIALGPGPKENESYLYIGDIGWNNRGQLRRTIYRIVEPTLNQTQLPIIQTINQVESIHFIYPNGSYDAEALIIDPVTRDILILTKEDKITQLFSLEFPQIPNKINQVTKVATLNLGSITAGDISYTGTEILLKNYFFIYYWKRYSDEELKDVLKRTPVNIPYFPEPQGEAICWDYLNQGFFTLSEELKGIPAHLYYYPRILTLPN
jgi:hypothetical protein